MKSGDRVTITFGDRTVPGEVVLVTKTGMAGALSFEAILFPRQGENGYAGMMPVMAHDDGSYTDLMYGEPVTIVPGSAA